MCTATVYITGDKSVSALRKVGKSQRRNLEASSLRRVATSQRRTSELRINGTLGPSESPPQLALIRRELQRGVSVPVVANLTPSNTYHHHGYLTRSELFKETRSPGIFITPILRHHSHGVDGSLLRRRRILPVVRAVAELRGSGNPGNWIFTRCKLLLREFLQQQQRSRKTPRWNQRKWGFLELILHKQRRVDLLRQAEVVDIEDRRGKPPR